MNYEIIKLAIPALVAAMAAILAPRFAEWYRQQFESYKSIKRKKELLNIIRSEFDNFGRHSGTNLRRLLELVQQELPAKSHSVLTIQKFSLINPYLESRSLFYINQIDDLVLLPQAFSRDIMRMHLFARNIEYEIKTILELIAESGGINHQEVHFRLVNLGDMFLRATFDSAKIVTKTQSLIEDEKSFRDEPIHWGDTHSEGVIEDWKIYQLTAKFTSVEKDKGLEPQKVLSE